MEWTIKDLEKGNVNPLELEVLNPAYAKHVKSLRFFIEFPVNKGKGLPVYTTWKDRYIQFHFGFHETFLTGIAEFLNSPLYWGTPWGKHREYYLYATRVGYSSAELDHLLQDDEGCDMVEEQFHREFKTYRAAYASCATAFKMFSLHASMLSSQ